MLKMYLSCCTPTSRISHSSILLTFGSKAPFKKLRNQRLSPGTKSQGFQSWRRKLDSLKLRLRYLRTRTWTSSEHQQLDKKLCENACLIWDSERKKKCFFSRQIKMLMSSSQFQGLVYRHLFCWTFEWSRKPTYISRESVFSLNCYLFSYILAVQRSELQMCRLFLGQNILPWSTVPILTLCFELRRFG